MGEARGVNAEIADLLTARQLQVRRAEARHRREIWALLALLEADMLAALRLADPTQSMLLARRRRAVEELMAEDIEPLVTTRYDRLATLTTAFLLALAQQEVAATQRLVGEVTDEPLVEEEPPAAAVRRGVTVTLIPSASKPTDFSTTGEDWWTRQGATLVQRVGDTLMTSVSLEESLPQAQARIRGTSAQGFQDGVMAKAKQDAARLLTTEVTNATSEAHVALAAANAEEAILVHVSILDSRTSMICIARHGLRYTADTHEPIGHALPYLNGVPYHPNCRSQIIPGTRTGGPIPKADLDTWLLTQSKAFQDDLLGPKRAQMWREGTLKSTRDLLDAVSGRPLTLEELGV